MVGNVLCTIVRYIGNLYSLFYAGGDIYIVIVALLSFYGYCMP